MNAWRPKLKPDSSVPSQGRQQKRGDISARDNRMSDDRDIS